jgi:phosphatidylinositol glycan class X
LSELLSYSCELIVIERLPSGVFADPFELQHLAQRGGKYSKPAFVIKTEVESGKEVSYF